MTVKEVGSKCVRIPVWIITLLIPIFFTAIGFTINTAKTQQEIITKLEQAEVNITSLQFQMNDKASTNEVHDLKVSLQRMEDKLDRLIERSIK